jgi:hypothetical protein
LHFGVSAHGITNTDDDEFGDNLKLMLEPSSLNDSAELGICVYGIENGIGLIGRRVILRQCNGDLGFACEPTPQRKAPTPLLWLPLGRPPSSQVLPIRGAVKDG